MEIFLMQFFAGTICGIIIAELFHLWKIEKLQDEYDISRAETTNDESITLLDDIKDRYQ